MSWKQWVAIVLVIGLGIVWQIPQHDAVMEDAGHPNHPAAPAATTRADDDREGPYRTIALEVTGMT